MKKLQLKDAKVSLENLNKVTNDNNLFDELDFHQTLIRTLKRVI